MAVVTTTTTVAPFYSSAWFWLIVIGFIFLIIGIAIYFYYRVAGTWVWVFIGLGLLLIIAGAIYAALRPAVPVVPAPVPGAVVRKTTTTTTMPTVPAAPKPTCTVSCMGVPNCDIAMATMGSSLRVAPGLPVGIPVTPVVT